MDGNIEVHEATHCVSNLVSCCDSKAYRYGTFVSVKHNMGGIEFISSLSWLTSCFSCRWFDKPYGRRAT